VGSRQKAEGREPFVAAGARTSTRHLIPNTWQLTHSVAGILSCSVPFYKPTEVSNRGADLFGRSAAFRCRSRTPTSPFGRSRTAMNRGPRQPARRAPHADASPTLTEHVPQKEGGVIWNGIHFETPVIPAKAGIQSVDILFPKTCGVDSRFRGNDCGLVGPCLANDTTTQLSAGFAALPLTSSFDSIL
jgi:hypothetical protein